MWRCPAHDDKTPSLSVSEGHDGRALLHCHAGCATSDIVAALGFGLRGLFPGRARRRKELPGSPPESTHQCTSHRKSSKNEELSGAAPRATVGNRRNSDRFAEAVGGCTLAAYAEAKRLPVSFLEGLGVREERYRGAPRVVIPYLDRNDVEVATRYRERLVKLPGADGRFKWKTGSGLIPYGVWKLGAARRAGFVVLVEGESDCHTLWHHGVPALGVPGASNWQLAWADHLEGIPLVAVVREPDDAGRGLVRKLAATPGLGERLRVLDLAAKDASELHLRGDAKVFRAAFTPAALKRAPLAIDEVRAAETAERKAAAKDAWKRCKKLARRSQILDDVGAELRRRGLVGDLRLGKVAYLAITSRLLDRPASILAKGPSGVGKNRETEAALELFPASAYYKLTSSSERALIYSEEPLAHRVLVIAEAAGVENEFTAYILRSLLSEGRVRYETVEKTSEGLRARLIEREGPTGVILTTTRVAVHPENETRLLSVPVDDTQHQTRRVLDGLALRALRGESLAPPGDGDAGLETWRSLQTWLEIAGGRRVAIPFAKELAKRIEPVAVRLRRDVGLLFALVQSHAILHQTTRARDRQGCIVANLADYAAIFELTGDLFAGAAQVAVSRATRETVEAVRGLLEEPIPAIAPALAPGKRHDVRVSELCAALRLDKSTVSRRLRSAYRDEYLRNLEERDRQPARIVLGDDLPEDRSLLRRPEELREAVARGARCCKGVRNSQGIDSKGKSSTVALLQSKRGGSQQHTRAARRAPSISPVDVTRAASAAHEKGRSC